MIKGKCWDIVLIETAHTSSVAGYVFRFRGRYYILWVCAVCTKDKGFGVFSVVDISNYRNVRIENTSSYLISLLTNQAISRFLKKFSRSDLVHSS